MQERVKPQETYKSRTDGDMFRFLKGVLQQVVGIE